MEIIHRDNPFYHITLENIFSDDDLNEIKKYLNNLTPHLEDRYHTKSAVDTLGNTLKKNNGIFLEKLQNDKNFIQTKIKKVVSQILKKSSWKNNCLKRYFLSSVWGFELVQFYQNEDYYLPHVDSGIFTIIIWFYENQQMVKGGDLHFPEYDYTHFCRDNCGIVFLSREIHEVTTVKSVKDYGRHSITIFSKECYDENFLQEREKYKSINHNPNIFYK